MVILMLFEEEDLHTGRKTGQFLVSHGVDTDTLENVTLPPVTPQSIGRYDTSIQEWVLK